MCVEDGFSLNQMRNLCGPLTIPIPYTISPPLYAGSFLTKNMYCRIEALNFDPTVVVSFNMTRAIMDPLDDISLEIHYYDTDFKIYHIKEQSFYADAFGISKFVINYLSVNAKQQTPFTIVVDINNKSDTNYIGLIIAVSVVVTLCLICSGVFYKCSKLIMEKNRIKEEADRRRRVMLLEQLDNRTRVEADAERDSHKKKLQQALKSLFENDLKPRKYKEESNEFHTNCTICLEDFKPESKVVTLLCKHVFHFECIKDWIKKQKGDPKCPNCNSKMVPDEYLERDVEKVDLENEEARTNNVNNVNLNHNDNNLVLRENIDNNQMRNNFIANDQRNNINVNSNNNNNPNNANNNNPRMNLLNPLNAISSQLNERRTQELELINTINQGNNQIQGFNSNAYNVNLYDDLASEGSRIRGVRTNLNDNNNQPTTQRILNHQ